MKKLFTLRSLLAVPLVALLSYPSAGKKAGLPPAKHVVQVRLTGQNLTGLGAEITVRTVLNWKQGYNPGHSFTQAIALASINETYKIGTFEDTDYIEAAIAFKNVTQDSHLQPAANAFLKVEVITDGHVGETTQLDATAKGWKVEYDPHLRGTVTVDTHRL